MTRINIYKGECCDECGKRSKTLLIHMISISIIMLIYGFTIGPLTNIGGVLFNVKDWFTVVPGFIVVVYLFLFKTVRRSVLEHLNWRELFVVKNILLSIGLLLILYLSYKYLILIDPFADEQTKTAMKYGLNYGYSLVTMI